MELTKKYILLWNAENEILNDYKEENTGKCYPAINVNYFESDVLQDVENKIVELGLKKLPGTEYFLQPQF